MEFNIPNYLLSNFKQFPNQAVVLAVAYALPQRRANMALQAQKRGTAAIGNPTLCVACALLLAGADCSQGT
jgi:hypothetical protein